MIDTSDQTPDSTAPTLPQNPARSIRDVVDFHLRWREFRPIAKTIGRNPALSESETDTLAWMIELLDRIGPQDLGEGGK